MVKFNDELKKMSYNNKSKIGQSKNDKRVYKFVRLNNNLDVLLIQDKNTKISKISNGMSSSTVSLCFFTKIRES